MSNDRDYEALLNTLAGRVRGNFRDIKALVYVMLHDKEDLERCVMWMMNNFATIPVIHARDPQASFRNF